VSATSAHLVLWLFVINLGIAFGAGVYEHRIVVARWTASVSGGCVGWDPDAARQDDPGRRFWGFVTTVPLTILTLANLFVAWRAPEGIRGWWLAAATAALADRLFTFAYFIPAMVALMAASASPESAAAAARWSTLNYLRHAIVLAAWLASMKAFAAWHAQRLVQ
jgi:hypothetical protein